MHRFTQLACRMARETRKALDGETYDPRETEHVLALGMCVDDALAEIAHDPLALGCISEEITTFAQSNGLTLPDCDCVGKCQQGLCPDKLKEAGIVMASSLLLAGPDRSRETVHRDLREFFFGETNTV